ncbi:MAG: hypothetical protein NVS9B2_29440 [Steroidobacteraceae bacterium]
MKTRKTRAIPERNINVRGFFRLHVIDDPDGTPTVVGDSGWCENLITNVGFDNGFNRCLSGLAGSSQITFAALGTGGAPIATDVALAGEITDVAGARMAVTPTTIASKTVQFAFTLASGVYTTTKSISNVGLFQTSTTAAGSLYAGNTYASSQLASNQAVNGSYQLRLS